MMIISTAADPQNIQHIVSFLSLASLLLSSNLGLQRFYDDITCTHFTVLPLISLGSTLQFKFLRPKSFKDNIKDEAIIKLSQVMIKKE